MAEHYYSFHSEEAAKAYFNYNVGQAQAQQQVNHFMGLPQINADYDYLPNTTYYTNASVAVNNVVDLNNNRSTNRNYNICNEENNSDNSLCINNQTSHIYANKVFPSALMPPKYSNTGHPIHGGISMLPNHIPNPETSQLNKLTVAAQPYYPHQFTGSTYNYPRNRYMPYNRCNSISPSLHQPIQLKNSAGYSQFATPINQTCHPVACVISTETTVQPPIPMTTNCNSKLSIVSNDSTCSHAATSSSLATHVVNTNVSSSTTAVVSSSSGSNVITSTPCSSTHSYGAVSEPSDTVTLQITNLDFSMDENNLRNFLHNQLKPITPVISLTFEGNSFAKVTVPDLHFAKQVVSNLHRKKIGHKRMLVSYTRDSSLTEINTLRCQVAGLLKDVPYYTLPMYKFRELFQSRFKTSISVLDLYKMQDICIINSDNNEEKFITLHPDLVNSLETSPLMEGLQHSVPYCTIHFKKEKHKGWAEQDIEPLPNVFMTITEIQQIINSLLKGHSGDIPVASLVHCIEGHLKTQIVPNENGVNLEHLVCCVQGIQITVNNFGIKILGWTDAAKENASSSTQMNPKNSMSDPLYQISREVIELIKMSPKATMKFNRFIPAYHNHFGKQCRVADYGYTKLIELFEALSAVVQIMGDGENRQITLTHRTQIRRFTSDLLRVLRAHGNKSVLLSQLPNIFSQTQSRSFDVTDYGVCDIVDILDGLVNSNIVVISKVQNGKDILISIPKRKQTASELEKTCVFAGEIVELFRNAPQYTILFQKFVRSYHYHFGYQCRLSDYGFQKLADLMEAVNGIVEMELTNDEDKKIYLNSKVARRVFAEQVEELIAKSTGSPKTATKLEDVMKLHKKKYGYQITPQALGVKEITSAFHSLPYVEIYEKDDNTWVICHNKDFVFRNISYKASKYLLELEIEKYEQKDSNNQSEELKRPLKLSDFINCFNAEYKENLTESTVRAMNHAFEISTEGNICLSALMKFLMNIIRLLENRTSMILQEIKTTLDCTISTTFEYGYPNLLSILVAYDDIFEISVGVTQERAEVTLLPNTEIRLTSFANHNHLFGPLKLAMNKQKNVRPRPPLSENNSRHRNNQGPPAKSRALSSDSKLYNNASASSASNYKTNSMPSSYQVSTRSMPSSTKNYISGISVNNVSNSSVSSTASYHSNMFNTPNNKENSLNSSMMFNHSFNTSSNSSSSYCDLNGSINPMAVLHQTAQPCAQQLQEIHATNPSQIQQNPPTFSTSKLWNRRHDCTLYQQPQQQPFVGPPTNLSLVAPRTADTRQTIFLPTTTETSAGLYELVNNFQMCPIYQPPKPDTPPSKNLPFWIDPIWKNNSNIEHPKEDLLNIRLPELKALNVLPMLLSPYSLSKTENMKQVFNFDSHDRKIA